MNDHEFPPARAAVWVLVGAIAIVLSAWVVGVVAALVLLAGFALLGAALRVVQPTARAFSVRRRAVDVGVLLVFAGALIFLAATTPLSV